MRIFLALGFLALAACGADGEPEPPEKSMPPGAPGVSMSISGTAKIGISG